MYNCPVVDYYPKVDGLTDLQVARLLVTMQKSNSTCKNSLESIRKFMREAQKTVESEKDQ